MIALTDALLQEWPLPAPGEGGKEQRGRVLVIAGSPQIAGAARLAGEAALRAGAGKLVIATAASVAPQLAISVPEARVIALPETAEGGFAASGIDQLQDPACRADAIVVGPGMQDDKATCALVRALLRSGTQARMVVDALAMDAVCLDGEPPAALPDAPVRDIFAPEALAQVDRDAHCEPGGSAATTRDAHGPQLVLTPHAGEMAHLTGASKDSISADPAAAALDAARRWNALVVLKGPVTHVAAPDGRLWRHDGGNAGLGVSGSGDVLAGLLGGLAARGATLDQAAAWAVRLHGRAGERLAGRFGVIGYLAREIAAEVPAMMDALAPRKQRRIGFG